MTLRSPLVLAAAVALGVTFSAPARAQLNPADVPVSNGPLGGSAVSLLVDPLDSDVVLVTKDGNKPGLWRSDDRGTNFAPYGAGLPRVAYPLVTDLTVDPLDSRTLYALFDTTVYRSTDFGANWFVAAVVSDRKLNALSVSSTGDLLTMDAFNVYRSTDGGDSWTTSASVVPFSGMVFDDVAFATSDPTIAYAIGNDTGLLKSTDSGASFTSMGHTGLWGQTVTTDPADAETVFVGTPFDGLQRSTDGGLSFQVVAPDSTTPVFNGEFFFTEPDGSALWYAVLDGVVRSTDGGDSWQLVNAGISADYTPIPQSMARAPNGDLYYGLVGGGLYDQSGGGLYRMDAGETAFEHIGFLEARINDVTLAGPGGARVVGIGSGVYASSAGGQVVPTAWHADIGTDTRAVAVDPDDPDRWVTGGVGAFLDNAQIVVVTNGGQSFTKPYDQGPIGESGGAITDIEFSPDDSDRVVAGLFPGAFGAEAILVSTDGGDSWSDVPGTAGWATVAVTWDPFRAGRVLQHSQNGQWSQSLDGGISWQALKPAWPLTGPAMMLEFDPHVQGRMYRGETGGGLWRSLDGGVTWTQLGVSLHEDSAIEFHPDFPGMFWVGDADGQLLLTGDGGDSFTVAWEVVLDANAGPLALDTSDGTLVVGTTLASMWELPGAAPVSKFGAGTAGSGAIVPELTLGGGLPQLGNTSFALDGRDLVGGSLVYMALGFTNQPQFAFGGVFEIGSPIWRFYMTSGAPGAPGAGSFSAAFPLPVDPVLVGLEVFAQCAIPDAGTPHPSQVALTNALSITFHE